MATKKQLTPAQREKKNKSGQAYYRRNREEIKAKKGREVYCNICNIMVPLNYMHTHIHGKPDGTSKSARHTGRLTILEEAGCTITHEKTSGEYWSTITPREIGEYVFREKGWGDYQHEKPVEDKQPAPTEHQVLLYELYPERLPVCPEIPK